MTIMEPLKNPFTRKAEELRKAAAKICDGCGAILPPSPDGTIRRWCVKTKAQCRKLYRAKTRLRTAMRY